MVRAAKTVLTKMSNSDDVVLPAFSKIWNALLQRLEHRISEKVVDGDVV